MFKIIGLGTFGAILAFVLTATFWWGIAGVAVSGVKAGLSKCHESWPAGQVVGDNWFCDK